MECPYCQGAMEPGNIISSRGPILWCPSGEKAGFFTTERKIREAGGFRVGRPKTWYEAEAWYCRTCNRLTIFDAKAR